MYSFEPSEEQKMLIDVVSRFAQNDLRPIARDADEGDDFSASVIEKGWELGILQASIPEEFGGFGERSAVTSVLAFEELAWGDLAGSLAILAPNLFAIPILLAGSEEQKQNYLPLVAESEWVPYTAAIIEPYFDFGLNSLRTLVEEDENAFVLNGKKINVPFADISTEFIVYANLDGRTQGFIVPASARGLEVGTRHKLLGINALPNYPVSLSNVRIPKENRLGGPGGCDISPVIDAANIALAAAAVGISRAAFEYSRDYAKEREAFGVKIAQKQAIAFMLAEMATEIEAIRLLTWEAAWMQDNQKPETSKSAYLALSGAIDLAMQVTDRAVQILGGHGYIREYPVEMWMRNGRGIANLAGIAMI